MSGKGQTYIRMDELSVGYNGKALIRDICIDIADSKLTAYRCKVRLCKLLCKTGNNIFKCPCYGGYNKLKSRCFDTAISYHRIEIFVDKTVYNI